jgi:hypothetical protein
MTAPQTLHPNFARQETNYPSFRSVFPGSRYLCIVQGAATKASPASLALPFEGDHTLTLILSKAFLLADDRKIKDQSILRQF